MSKKNKTPLLLIEPDDEEDEVEIIVKQKNKNNVTLKKKNIIGKRRIKNKPILIIDEELNTEKIEQNLSVTPIDTNIQLDTSSISKTISKMTEVNRYNEKFIDLMEQLNTIMLKQGEPFRARAYQKAQETIMGYKGDITSVNQLKELPNIGPTIIEKLNEFVETGTLRVLEKEKNNPVTIFLKFMALVPKMPKS